MLHIFYCSLGHYNNYIYSSPREVSVILYHKGEVFSCLTLSLAHSVTHTHAHTHTHTHTEREREKQISRALKEYVEWEEFKNYYCDIHLPCYETVVECKA